MRHRRANTTTPQAFEGLRADYDAAKDSRYRRRLTGYSPMGSGADYHVRNWTDNLRQMELARFFDRNDMVVGQGITRVIRNILQDGINVDPQTGDEEVDAYVAPKWRGWSQDPDQCDKAGEHDLHTQAKLILRSVIVDGDVCVLLLKEGPLQAIEAHRLRTPTGTRRNVAHGVLLDDYRKHLEYWFTRDNIPPFQNVQRVGDMLRYPARDDEGNRAVLQVYNPKRFSQTRGVTHLAPIANPVGMHDDLQFANLVRAQVAACFAIFHERESDFGGDNPPQRGEATTETLADGTTRAIEGIAPGMEIFGAPGDKLIGFSPNVPNPEFFTHAKMVLTFIAVNLDLPVAVLLLDPSETNFSGWRGAMDQARLGFRDIQKWMIGQFYRPVYEWKLRQWLATDPKMRAFASRIGVDIFAHEWHPPGWSYIEPWKDAQADNLRIKGGLSSLRRIHAERGRDWDNVSTEIVEDRAKLVRKALAEAGLINTEYPDARVNWRELAAGFDIKAANAGSQRINNGNRPRDNQPSTP